MYKISPSVLACNLADLGNEIKAMDKAGVDMIHLDVMDGHFVPNLSFGAPLIAKARPYTHLMFDVHLMISNPLQYIDDFVLAGADRITFHVESSSNTQKTIQAILNHGKEAGLTLKPGTPISEIEPYLEKLAMVLVMMVEPGFGGQAFQKEMLSKIKLLAKIKKEKNLSFDIQVDGGIDTTTAAICARAGANVFVAGTALYGQDDYTAAVKQLRQAILAE